MCPPNSHEAVADRAGRRESQRIRGEHSGSSKNVSRDTEEHCTDSHESQQERYGWYEFKCSKRRARTHPGCNDQGDREKSSDAPRRKDSPPDAEPSRRLGVKNRWVKDGEVFDADSCSELVVNNPVQHSRNNAGDRNFERLHRLGATWANFNPVRTS